MPSGRASALAPPLSYADVVDRVAPAVVTIRSSRRVRAPQQFPFFDDPLFRQFFGGNQSRGGATEVREALGSGVIVRSDGHILTNHHVVDGAEDIKVDLISRRTYSATLVGSDPPSDLAVLKISADNLPVLELGDSDQVRVGDVCLAVGNPLGVGQTVTAGIVSAKGRATGLSNGSFEDFLQTDAPINQGNSGGPLFNMDGEVIGVNTAIYSRSGGSIGLGFSIPSNQAKRVVAQLRNFGHARRGWLGVKIQQVTPDIAESLGLKEPVGAMIASTDEKGPAAAAKLQGGDVILKFNGTDVKEMRTLPRLVAETEIGKQVPIVVWRDGKELSLQVTVGELPDDVKPALAAAKPDAKAAGATTKLAGMGLTIGPITDDLRDKFQLPADQKGVIVTDVTPDSAAGEKGLKPGDVIVEVQQEEVKTPADVTERIERYRKANRRTVLLLVQTGDGLHWVPLPLTAAPAKGQGG